MVKNHAYITCVILFVYDNVVYVPTRFMLRGLRQVWARVWSCGAVFSCLCWGLSVTPVCFCGCVDILSCLRCGWQLQVCFCGVRVSIPYIFLSPIYSYPLYHYRIISLGSNKHKRDDVH